MANNFLEFSEVLEHLTPDEEKWLTAQFQLVAVSQGREIEIDDVNEAEDAEWVGPRFLRDNEDYDPDFGCDFQYAFSDESSHDWGRYLWLYAEESGSPEQVAWLVRKFLKQFRPDQSWSLTWACWCSKPRVGEFDGGAVFVTADDIVWQSTHEFIRDEKTAFEARTKTAQTENKEN